ncbi:hypothetical protein [Adhaeribacter rhizoryzae]|uniref:DUF6311 domain-containing protein n=1 Tax=Adhaeribacter rhizoryzae TaxID=2607907 RepID=A0A5M6DQV3_9BACT|nr:hypothetical protein [Adhaeribacter rhizoryzae]KAA5548622.1 hypothetical protein F0145_03650 [Adhaeribacter rhizoryzae]
MLQHNKFLLAARNIDWLKNYFTFQAYLQQPFALGLLKFEHFNYPFGEYILYTDNSPVFAIAVKLFSNYIFDVSADGLFVYHLFLVSGILLSTFLLFQILTCLIQDRACIIFFSLILPWLQPQLFRLGGHFSLSFSFVLLLGILFLLRSYRHFYTGKNIIKELFWFVPALIIVSFIHLYYLPLVLVLVGYFCAAWVLQAFFRNENYRFLIAWSIAAVLIPLCVTYSIIRLTDGYYELRPDKATGYSFVGNKLHLSDLYTAYAHNHLKFNYLFTPEPSGNWEPYAYLGSFALYVGALLLIMGVFRLFFKAAFFPSVANHEFTRSFLLLFGVASFGSLFISLGDYFNLFSSDLPVRNYLNIFRYLKKITESVTHFRALDRFGWVFFWFINLLVIYYYDQLLQSKSGKIVRFVAYTLALLALSDTLDAFAYYHRNVIANELTDPTLKKELYLAEGIQVSDFQAILPIPFYYIGTEETDLEMSVPEDFQTKTIQLSLTSNLPLMASQMSRTAPAQAKEIFSLITGQASSNLKSKLNNKPLLVAVDTTLYNQHIKYCEKVPFRSSCQVYEAGRTFVQRHQLQPIGKFRNVILYSYKY